MLASRMPDSTAELAHEKSVEILSEVGFCVPERDALARLEAAGFPVDWESQMLRVTPELLETALARLPHDVKLYDRRGRRQRLLSVAPSAAFTLSAVEVLRAGPASWAPARR